MPEIVIRALYRFVVLEDFEAIQPSMLERAKSLGIKGTLLLAREGINGTIAGERPAMDAFIAYLRQDGRLETVTYKESIAEEQPFYRMKVRLKREIVTMGIDGIDPNKIVGTYVQPQEWNELISSEDTIVVDTRNEYEVSIGTFKNAINPHTESFREFPQWVEDNRDLMKGKKVAMFCTGGIRCEKATAFVKEQGFDEVYHLEGGILKYLEDTPEEKSLWEGECFVFDNRVTVNHQLEPGSYDMCHACRMPLSEEDMRSDRYIPGISCPHCHDKLTPEQRAAATMRQKQVELSKARGESHIGSAGQING